MSTSALTDRASGMSHAVATQCSSHAAPACPGGCIRGANGSKPTDPLRARLDRAVGLTGALCSGLRRNSRDALEYSSPDRVVRPWGASRDVGIHRQAVAFDQAADVAGHAAGHGGIGAISGLKLVVDQRLEPTHTRRRLSGRRTEGLLGVEHFDVLFGAGGQSGRSAGWVWMRYFGDVSNSAMISVGLRMSDPQQGKNIRI